MAIGPTYRYDKTRERYDEARDRYGKVSYLYDELS